jgi:hypothetical protein
MNWLSRLSATGSANAMRSDLYNEATFYNQKKDANTPICIREVNTETLPSY